MQKLSLDVQNPLAVSSDELREQRAVVLDGGGRVDGAQEGRAALYDRAVSVWQVDEQEGRAARYLELHVRRRRGGAGVAQPIRVA